MARSMPLLTLVRIIILIFLILGSIIYWAGMGANTYGSANKSSNARTTFGLYKYCEIVQASLTQYTKTCTKYNQNPPFIHTSIALFAVFVTLDVVLIIITIALVFVRPKRKIKEKLFLVDLITAIIAFLCWIFLWASFIYYSNELRRNIKGLKLSSGFGAAISGFFILNVVLLAMAALPFMSEFLSADRSQIAQKDFAINDQQSAYFGGFVIPNAAGVPAQMYGASPAMLGFGNDYAPAAIVPQVYGAF